MLVAAAPAIQPLATVESAVRAFVSAELGEDRDSEFTLARLDPRLRLPLCELPLSTRNTHTQRAGGAMSVEVRCHGEKPWVLYVPVQVERYASVAVAARAIPQNQLIAAADIQFERRRVDPRQANYLTNASSAIGQVALRSIGSGQVLSARLLKQLHLVRRGDRVVLSIGSRAISVKVQGEALQDGVAGERIKVRNLSSERVVQGIVTASGSVVVPSAALL